MKPVLSVVGPVFNEAQSLPLFHDRLLSTLKNLGEPFEIIYVNDGSRDETSRVLRALHEREPSVKVLEFSRNFGHQLAITAGMDHAGGQACVIIDTDGQDPPELIARLVEQWRLGSEVVYAVRSRRQGEGFFKRATAALFYRLMRRITSVDIPLDAGDFRLIDRKVLDVMARMRETHRFMRGMTCWAGFRQSKVEYPRASRLAGETGYPLWKMLRLALDGITSFSHAPLRWVTLCGLAASLLSVLIGFWVLWVRVFNAQAVRGWTSLMVMVLFMGGLNLVALGVIGEYLARIFDEVKDRPLYVVSRKLGL